MSDDYAFFEYKAKITNSGHAENEGEPVHCMIKMKSLDEHGKRRRNVELEQQAGDDVLFVINPGPHRKISHSSIWSVSEETFQKAETALDQHRLGDCEIFFNPAPAAIPPPVASPLAANSIRRRAGLERSASGRRGVKADEARAGEV